MANVTSWINVHDAVLSPMQFTEISWQEIHNALFTTIRIAINSVRYGCTEIFERQYSEEECLWGLSPSPLLIKKIEEVPVGKALDLGVGEGRNALFLALKSFQVTGIDVSPKSIEKFLDLAKERGLTVEGLVMDILDFKFSPDAYNLIVAANTLHFLRKKEVYEITSNIIRSIAPGGYVYIEDFTVNDPSYQNAKKKLEQIEENMFYSLKQSSYLYFFQHNELKEMFKDFEIKVYKEEIIIDTGHGESDPHEHSVAVLFAKNVDDARMKQKLTSEP